LRFFPALAMFLGSLRAVISFTCRDDGLWRSNLSRP